VIVNEVPIQQIIALPYDRWEGYAADRREILSFIRDQHIRNVVFLTTDLHGNVFGPVRVDLFDDPTPVAYEAVVGPIATATLKQEIASAISDTAANLFAPLLLSVVKADCASIDTYSYGSVDIDPAAGTLTVTARDASGAALCSKTLQAER
jgi:phosphodiesterase/alkaline phosphatase D-like protein